ncbi:hypothetical protein EV562_113185 [Streptomyces sp. BK208]|nr:hypothetical protein EV562_113185 [Streptomyces sp. BK208]
MATCVFLALSLGLGDELWDLAGVWHRVRRRRRSAAADHVHSGRTLLPPGRLGREHALASVGRDWRGLRDGSLGERDGRSPRGPRKGFLGLLSLWVATMLGGPPLSRCFPCDTGQLRHDGRPAARAAETAVQGAPAARSIAAETAGQRDGTRTEPPGGSHGLTRDRTIPEAVPWPDAVSAGAPEKMATAAVLQRFFRGSSANWLSTNARPLRRDAACQPANRHAPLVPAMPVTIKAGSGPQAGTWKTG